MKMKIIHSLTSFELKDLINAAKARLATMELEASTKNTEALIKAILDLNEGLGVEDADGFAPTRLYVNTIPGVKNIRFQGMRNILVKIVDSRGKLLPEKVVIDTNTYIISWTKSSNYVSNYQEMNVIY